MRTMLAPALLFLLAVGQVGDRPAEAAADHRVRAVAPAMAALLEDARARSPLVRSLVSQLDRSDVVVYLTETFASEAGEPKGTLRFLVTAGGQRYLAICIDRWMLSWNDRLVLLAHELQHAVEVASAPEVRDLPSFRALYTRIGWEMRWGRFETNAACEASVRMRNDLGQTHHRPATNQD